MKPTFRKIYDFELFIFSGNRLFRPIDSYLQKADLNSDDLLQLTILLEQLTNRNDLYHLSLIKGANLALNIKDDLATAFEFCRVIVDNNFSTHGGWEICQTMVTKMSSRHGCTFFRRLIRPTQIFGKSAFSRNRRSYK